MGKITINGMGLAGVNVDANALELGDNELTQATNGGSDPSAGRASIRKRPGLVAFTTTTTAGTVLGGVTIPLQNLSVGGVHYLYIGRGAA